MYDYQGASLWLSSQRSRARARSGCRLRGFRQHPANLVSVKAGRGRYLIAAMLPRRGWMSTSRAGGQARAGPACWRRPLWRVDVEGVLPNLGQDRPRLRREIPVCSWQVAGDSPLWASERLRRESALRGSIVVTLGQALLQMESP